MSERHIFWPTHSPRRHQFSQRIQSLGNLGTVGQIGEPGHYIGHTNRHKNSRQKLRFGGSCQIQLSTLEKYEKIIELNIHFMYEFIDKVQK